MALDKGYHKLAIKYFRLEIRGRLQQSEKRRFGIEFLWELWEREGLINFMWSLKNL